MLKESKTFSSFATDDLQKANAFYADTLGLAVESDAGMPVLTLHLAGGTVIIYEKSDFKPAGFTVLNFPVPDIDQALEALVSKGVQFEQYGGDIQTDEKGVYRGKKQSSGPDIAWFKDPAGNILSILTI